GQVRPELILDVERLQIEGVAADDLLAQAVFRRAFKTLVDPVVRCFAPADKALIRLEPDEQRLLGAGGPIARLIRRNRRFLWDANAAGVELCDFHESLAAEPLAPKKVARSPSRCSQQSVS